MSLGPQIFGECSPPSRGYMSCVTSHVSPAMCHMSGVTCHIIKKIVIYVLEVVDGGSFINQAYNNVEGYR